MSKYIIVYYCLLGKDKTLDSSFSTSVTHNTVMKLVEYIHNKGHHLYMDNFYTSPALFISLSHVGIGACGTLRCNRQGIPSSIKDSSTPLTKGDIITATSNGLLFLKWKDESGDSPHKPP